MEISYKSKDEYSINNISIPKLFDCQFCVFDFEGTGIDYRKEHITQIGGIFIDKETIDIGHSFNSLVKSVKLIPPAIEELTGITNMDMKEAPMFPEVYKRFVNFVNDDVVLVTQAGYEYDIPLLKKFCDTYDLPMLKNQVIDTKALFTNIHREIDDVISTDFLINYYEIDTSDLKRHNALDDCVLISKIFLSILKEYRVCSIPEFIVKEELIVKRFVVPDMYLKDGNNIC